MASYETVGRITEKLEANDIPYAVVGGTVTAALADRYTYIAPQLGFVSAAPSSDVSLIRDNGTRRDADILILSGDAECVAEANSLASDASNGELEVSTFGFEQPQNYTTRMQRFGGAVLQNYTSSRVMHPDGTVTHNMYPFVAEIPKDALDGWSMAIPDGPHINILDPRYHLLSYEVRSVGGLRPKDNTVNKYQAAVKHVAEAFADVDASLVPDLSEMEAIKAALHDIQDSSLIAAVKRYGFFGFKSKAIHTAEKQMWVVDTFQKLSLETGPFKRFVK